MKKRVVRVGFALAAVGALVVGVLVWLAGQAGTSPVEAWVAGQIQAVADAYLNPKLTFTDLDYEFPAKVRLKSLRLTADDPANPGKTLDILACERAEIELTDMPKPGEPIQIASIVLRKPVFNAVAYGDGTKRLVGYSELICKAPATTELAEASAPVAAATAPAVATAAATPTPTTAPNVPRLSDFLRMKRVELVDGRILSDARLPGVPPMEIDKITTRLAVEPADGGWYSLDTRITRDPIFDLKLTGRVNLDTFTAADAVVELEAQVAREHDKFLPPDLQKFLRAHEVHGVMRATVTAQTLPLLDPSRGRMKVEASLADANVSYQDYRVPIEALVLSAALEDGVVNLSRMEMKALRGAAEARGTLALNDARDLDARLVVRNMILDDTIKDGTATAKQPKFGGRVSVQLAAAASLTHLVASATTQPAATIAAEQPWGRGKIEVDQGRLVHSPLVQGLGRAITKSTSWLRRGGTKTGKGTGTDRATVMFELVAHEARCSEITYVGDVFAARGHGAVGFNQELDLIVNGGPLEKMQHMMGRHVGGMFARLTDALAGYHVTGTVAEPQVGMQLAGGRVNRAGRAVTGGIGSVRSGIGSLGDRIAGNETDER